MSETPETQVSVEEIESVIGELEQYRERIVNDALQIAKKVKLSKKVAMEHLEANPEIIQIDAALEKLRTEQSALRSPSTVK
ncbi:MAG: acetyltransferase [Xenococcaceae cyanobacterium]